MEKLGKRGLLLNTVKGVVFFVFSLVCFTRKVLTPPPQNAKRIIVPSYLFIKRRGGIQECRNCRGIVNVTYDEVMEEDY